MINVEQFFYYKDGGLYWKDSRRGGVKAGDKAGWLDNGYWRIQVDGETYLEHRLIFLLHYGFLPEFVDHKDNNSLNNHPDNLRECDKSTNNYNAKLRVDNKSGIKGVTWYAPYGKWVCKLGVNGKQKHLGYYDDLELAELVMNEARERYHHSFARFK